MYYSTLAPKISRTDRVVSACARTAKANWCITKLSREGKLNEAREVFDQMHTRDVITWTAVISGYIKSGWIEEARRLFDRDDAIKDVVTWTAMVNGYLKLNLKLEAEKLFMAMPSKNVIAWNTMIGGYMHVGEVDKGLDLFMKMPERNVVSWNLVITALTEYRRVEEAKILFEKIPQKDVVSWTTMVAGLAKNERIDEARELFERMSERTVVTWNAMITGYAKNMRLDEAFILFEMMPAKDIASWNTMITGFIQTGELERARKLFVEMPEKNVVSWTALITGCVQLKESESALIIFAEMIRDGNVKPNEGTFVNILSACSDLAGLSEGQQVHQIISKSILQHRAFVVSALINMYSKCGELGISQKIFDDTAVNQRDLISWNCMIAAYAHHGCGREAIILFDQMQKSGFKPNDVSYVALLSACVHAGLVEQGLKYFQELLSDGSTQVREDHHTCLVDLYGRAGRLEEAYDFVRKLNPKESSSIWGSLLASCTIHGDLRIGRLVAERLLVEGPKNGGSFWLMSNMYASVGKWKEVERLRLEVKDKGLKKQPGCSWLEVGNKDCCLTKMLKVPIVISLSRQYADLIHFLIVYVEEDEQIQPVLLKEQPKSKWDDEDVDEDEIKESWEDEDESPTVPASKPVPEKVPKKPVLKSTKEKTVEPAKEEPPLDPVAEKLRQQRLVEEADYRNTKELFGSKSSTNEKNIDNFIPKSESDFLEYAELISQRLRLYEKSYHFISLLKTVMRHSMTSLKAADAKEVASSVTAIANEKLKAEKEANAGKKKTGGKKKQLHVDKPDDDIVVTGYDALDDYDFM
ncbi:unnamed protein product [Linum tenue]|uniref:Eukaryotic translation initiation factor 3 subunit J n=1 Tax=Linum tenue TaxID=586396 RepID=A0AAV0HTB8_9ROSI|nr:unnamed protein product [Linum tenue]